MLLVHCNWRPSATLQHDSPSSQSPPSLSSRIAVTSSGLLHDVGAEREITKSELLGTGYRKSHFRTWCLHRSQDVLSSSGFPANAQLVFPLGYTHWRFQPIVQNAPRGLEIFRLWSPPARTVRGSAPANCMRQRVRKRHAQRPSVMMIGHHCPCLHRRMFKPQFCTSQRCSLGSSCCAQR